MVLTDATVSKGRSYVAFTAGGTNGTTIVFKLSEDRLYTGGGNVYTGFGVIESSEPNLSSLIQNGLDNNAGATLPAGMPFGCACNANGSSASNCDSGGQGSTECMTTSSLSVGVGYTTGCSVSCGGGYYSCCTN